MTGPQSGGGAAGGSPAAVLDGLLPRPRLIDLGGAQVPFRPPVVRLDTSLPADGYRLLIGPAGVSLRAGDDAGAFYGRCTLAQLRRACHGRLPEGEITDWPDRRVRGVLLDISRAKVPSAATLRALAGRLASWKFNQLQLYMEHTFPYAGHEEVWRDASPVPAGEIAALDAYCRERHVELVPCQNTLGHFGRWLRLERYLPLAASPAGWRSAEGAPMPPMTLDPSKPAARDLVQDLLSQLLPWFSSRRVNVGLDEPWELGDSRAGEWAGWLAWLRGLRLLEGRQMLVWGDMLAAHPALAGSVPPGVTVCDWGYEAGHPFGQRAAALAAAGLPFYLCPGTSSWNSITGRLSNARANCAAAAIAAARHGGDGLLVTDWGDGGHLQYQPVTEAALAYAAGVAWCAEANHGMDLAAVLSAVVFEDPGGQLGAAAAELGDAYLALPAQARNASALTAHLWRPGASLAGALPAAGLREGYQAARQRVADALRRLGQASSQRADGDLVTAELRAGGELVLLLCEDAIARLDGDGTLAGVPASRRSGFARTADDLARRHRELWLARNRPGGLPESLAPLEALARAYRDG